MLDSVQMLIHIIVQFSAFADGTEISLVALGAISIRIPNYYMNIQPKVEGPVKTDIGFKSDQGCWNDFLHGGAKIIAIFEI